MVGALKCAIGIFVVTLLAGCVTADGGPMSDNTEPEIQALQQAWMQAWKDKDAATLERILGDDFVLIVSAAPTQGMGRDAWLAAARADYVCESFEYRNMVVRKIGDVVAVSSTLDVKAAVKGVDRSMEFFITDIWERRNGRWQVVQRYSSVPERPSASSDAVVKRN